MIFLHGRFSSSLRAVWWADLEYNIAGERYVRVRDFNAHDSSDSDSEPDDDGVPDFTKVWLAVQRHCCRHRPTCHCCGAKSMPALEVAHRPVLASQSAGKVWQPEAVALNLPAPRHNAVPLSGCST